MPTGAEVVVRTAWGNKTNGNGAKPPICKKYLSHTKFVI